ncbi:MAG TPA: MmgE/PrpD family protein [Gaiellaceae bacterium]|jgi:2-methylcitrate dehydratase PrpD
MTPGGASGSSVAHDLAEFVLDDRRSRIADESASQIENAFLDQLGCQIIGSTLPWTAPSYELARTVRGEPGCTVVNRPARPAMQYAAFANAAFGHGAELDDYGVDSGTHSGSVVVPVALAVAEAVGSTGPELFEAIGAGYDVGWVLGRAIRRPLHERGYHTHAVIGAFSATATAGKLLGLSPAQLAHAFGIAGSHASGTMEYDQTGGEVKRAHSGIAALSGIHSALLAQAGLTGPSAIFEGRRGIFRVLAGVEDVDLTYELYAGVRRNGLKQYPVTASQHSPISVLDRLIKSAGFEADDVVGIEVHADAALVLHIGTIYEPEEVIQAQFSLPFSLAVRLLKGRNDIRDYTDPDTWHDAEVLALAHKVRFRPDESLHGAKFTCTVTVELRDGRVVSGETHHAKGHCDDPLTPDEVRAKFHDLADEIVSVERADEIVRAVGAAREGGDARDLASLLAEGPVRVGAEA